VPVMFGKRALDTDGSISVKIGCVQSAAGRTLCKRKSAPRPSRSHPRGPEPSWTLIRDEIDLFALWIASHNAQSRLTSWAGSIPGARLGSQVQPQYPANLKSFLIESAPWKWSLISKESLSRSNRQRAKLNRDVRRIIVFAIFGFARAAVFA
jgi:hypothetical protein